MKLAFEGLLIALMLAVSILFVGIPLIKLIKMLLPARKDPVKEAEERLEIARKEAEAARLNKEAEKVYSRIYEEVLEEDSLEEESDRRKV